MKKSLFIPLALLTSAQAFADEKTDNIYLLSNQTMDAVTRLGLYPTSGKFKLTKSESDIVHGVGVNDYLIGDYIGSGVYKKNEEDCDRKEKISLLLVKDYEKRKYKVGAIAIGSVSKFEQDEKQKFNLTTYADFMRTHGYENLYIPSRYEWATLMGRFNEYRANATPFENASRLAELLRDETGLNVPLGALTSEFIQQELIKRPGDWKSILESSKDVLSFDEKISLVSQLGGKFGGDYNYERQKQDVMAKGVIPLTALLGNLSTNEAGGVCRDIALAQSMMLKSMGLNESYLIQYVSSTGGHVNLVAVDPDNKNRIIKLNYGEVSSDDARKGIAAIEQDNTLPNVGMRYRIFDNEGKPLASVPTQMGSLLREVTGNSKDIEGVVHDYTLGKVYFGVDKVEGNLFSGRTSTGETISGVALSSQTSGAGYLDASGGISFYHASAEKKYYRLNENGLYAHGSLGAKAVIYEGEYGKLGGGVGFTAEVLVVGVGTKSKTSGGKISKIVVDGEYGAYAKTNYEIDVSDRSKIGAEMEIKGRLEKKNAADEGSYGFQYDSTVLIAKYNHKIAENLTTSIAVAETLSKSGNSTALKLALEKGYDRFVVTANFRNDKDNPLKFLPDQQNAVKVAYERASRTGWNFKLEYGKNFDSKSYQVTGSAEKKF